MKHDEIDILYTAGTAIGLFPGGPSTVPAPGLAWAAVMAIERVD